MCGSSLLYKILSSSEYEIVHILVFHPSFLSNETKWLCYKSLQMYLTQHIGDTIVLKRRCLIAVHKDCKMSNGKRKVINTADVVSINSHQHFSTIMLGRKCTLHEQIKYSHRFFFLGWKLSLLSFHTAAPHIYTFTEVDDISSHLPQLPPSPSHSHPSSSCALKKDRDNFIQFNP